MAPRLQMILDGPHQSSEAPSSRYERGRDSLGTGGGGAHGTNAGGHNCPIEGGAKTFTDAHASGQREQVS